jgi:hypothetical protein
MRTLLPLLALSSCTWISDADVAAHKAQVDDDGDGVSAETDCNDADPAISPKIEDVPYDGLDADCRRDDDYDADEDGYVPTEYAGATTKVWVNGTSSTIGGALPSGDCDDDEPMVSPQQPDGADSANEYDGIDNNCDGLDDYDSDQDGYVPTEYVGLPTAYVTGSGALPGNDCNDHLFEVNPAATDDFDDGVDADCGGEDDYDHDGDGFITDEVALSGDYGPTVYAEETTGVARAGDCDDENADVYPLAPDECRDGTDADCALNDDYDCDGDGYVEEVDVGKTTGGVDGSGALPGGDCDDDDPARRPRRAEVAGDGVDGDCDGGDSTIQAWPILGYVWKDALQPHMGEANGFIYASVPAARITFPDGTEWFESAVALGWAASALENDADLIVPVGWNKNVGTAPAYTLSGSHAFIVADDAIYGALGLLTSGDYSLSVVTAPLDGGNPNPISPTTPATLGSAFDDVSVALDEDGVLYAVGCDATDSVLEYIAVEDPETANATSGLQFANLEATVCELDMRNGVDEPHIWLTQDGSTLDATFDATEAKPTFTTVERSVRFAPDDIDAPPEWSADTLVFADSTIGKLVLFHLAELAADDSYLEIGDVYDTDATTVDAFALDDGRLALVWVSNGIARLAYGTEALDDFTFSDIGTDFTATGAAVWASGTTLLVVVTGDDALGVGVLELGP